MRIGWLAALVLVSCSGCANGAPPARDQDGREVLVTGLDTPWGIDFLPDGRMVFTERPGRVSVLEDGRRQVVGTVGVSEHGEGGLLGIAVDPDFSQNSHVYLYYTGAKGNRVSRFVLRDGRQLEGETVLIDGIPSAVYHNGGRLRFSPDGKLFITTGDAREPRLAQDRNSLTGKILRIDKDGSIPADNPFGNAVWAYGIRNSQGLAWHPATNELYASGHGPNRRDEVNIIRRGADYGWPRTCDEKGSFVHPIRCYTDFTLAPCGIAFAGDRLFVAALRGTQVRLLRVPNNHLAGEETFLDGLGRIRDVVARDGWLYVATSNRDGRGDARRGDDRILRVRIGE